VETYCRAGQTTDGSIIRRMCVACWVTKTTETHSYYVILKAAMVTHLYVTLHVHCLVAVAAAAVVVDLMYSRLVHVDD
jgi:hypothetical protein